MSGWDRDCTKELQGILESILNPVALGRDIRNPNFAAPDVDQVPLDVSLEIAYGDEWREHRLFIKPDSLRGTERGNLAISTMSVTLFDHADISILPFNPVAVRGQKVRLRNGNQTDWYFKGFVKDQPRRMPFSIAESTNRELANYTINFVDELSLFNRIPIREVITGPTTEGAMLADLCGRYVPELDLSGINTALGQPIDRRTIPGLYLFQLFQEANRRNPDMTFYLDISQTPSRIVWDRRTSPAVLLPTRITDDNLYTTDLAGQGPYAKMGDFDLRKSSSDYKNRIVYKCPRLWIMGTADFDFGNDIVYGTGTNWLGNVFSGDTMRKPGSRSSYTISEVLSSGELYLSGPCQDETATDSPYEIISSGDYFEVFAEDSIEIERNRLLTGDVGDNAGVIEVVIEDSTPLTEEEAQFMADTSLTLEGWEGMFKTNNILLPLKFPHVGNVFHFDTPLRDVQAYIPIQTIDWQITRGYVEPRSGREDPKIEWTFDFTNRELLSESTFRQLLLANRRARLNDQAKLKINRFITERYVVGACVAFTYGENVEHSVTWSTSDHCDYLDPALMYAERYPRDLADGQLPMDPAGDDPASVWYPT